ncbi:flagellar hook-basal body complex protein FliE 1 [Terrihabitans soli]|uniref:Flagellar hook-basal body complex protein FliE n=1 Tax=Terrihabitans soli TaxID=708113 RepID=A0A6S6QQ02_9HYPH|nr:flagellar hook-basal body complex protein FliE [Terrihabitans soli]BCJ91596.1 flagellar hook-basal body complex protein FliE 1 [Terrihabitans soli]
MSSPLLAANAYKSLATLGAPSLTPQPGAGLAKSADSGGFGEMLQQVVGAVSDSGRNADLQTAKAVQGKGDLVDVVTAVAESEVAMETLVSVRDRVISAYEEIMRMPI